MIFQKFALASLLLLVPFFICSQQQEEPQSMKERSASKDSQRQSRTSFQMPLLSEGVHEQSIPRWDGDRSLRFTISIPAGYSSKKAVPLVMALHFGGEVTPYYGKNLIIGLVGPAFENLGAIIIAPDSLMSDWTSAKDEEAVLFLMDSVIKSYKIDPKKVVVTGYSMGGIGAWHFAQRYPDRFSAAIPIAGVPVSSGEWHTPVYAIHSRHDKVVPLEPTKKRIEQLKSQGINVHLIILEGIDHYATYKFQEPLKRAIPWLRETWK